MKILRVVFSFVILLIISLLVAVGATAVVPHKPYIYTNYDSALEAVGDVAENHVPGWAEKVSLYGAKDKASGKIVYVIKAENEEGRAAMWTGEKFVAWGFDGK